MAKARKVNIENDEFIAKKDWQICTGAWLKEKKKFEIDILIKKGQNVSELGLSGGVLAALKTEHVI